MQALTTVFLCMLFRLQDMDALVPAVLRSLTGKHEETLVPMGMQCRELQHRPTATHGLLVQRWQDQTNDPQTSPISPVW